MANLDHCFLVWMLSSASSKKKTQNLPKQAVNFLCNNFEISYEELLSKCSTSLVNVERLRLLSYIQQSTN